MVIHRIESEERKDKQQNVMVRDCMIDWCWLNNKDYQIYNDIMNMETYRFNDEHRCYVATSNLFNPNKW